MLLCSVSYHSAAFEKSTVENTDIFIHSFIHQCCAAADPDPDACMYSLVSNVRYMTSVPHTCTSSYYRHGMNGSQKDKHVVVNTHKLLPLFIAAEGVEQVINSLQLLPLVRRQVTD